MMNKDLVNSVQKLLTKSILRLFVSPSLIFQPDPKCTIHDGKVSMSRSSQIKKNSSENKHDYNQNYYDNKKNYICLRHDSS